MIKNINMRIISRSVLCFTLLALFLLCLPLRGQNVHQMTVNVKKIGSDISSTMYGLFFEDINFAADGGLYAELIKNRSFDFPFALTGWDVAGNVTIQNDGPFKNNPNYVRLANSGHGAKHTSLTNQGFFGIGVREGEKYRFSVYARTINGPGTNLRIELIDQASMGENQAFVQTRLRINSPEWQKYTVEITSPRTMSKAALRIFFVDGGTVDLEHISLFPVETWNGRENGLRKDLVQALADIKPGIFRFPGGCIVEGTDLDTRYNWKNSVGPVENRKLNENRWHYTFDNRFFPDYFQTYGLGFYEYFLLCEDIGAEPLPVVSCGLACQFQNGVEAHCPLKELDQYIQDAIDLVEFANGDVSTEWGKVRAEMGHPEPFGMKYLAVGNEQWGQEYIDRLKPFVKELRKKCPDIQIIGGSGPYSGGEHFDFLWPEMRNLKVDLVDEHYYSNENWFSVNAARYDSYDRKGPKVFAGEYACHGTNRKWNHFNASLLEAGFMTGLERNADIVRMATYAPLFAHVEGWQWRPDLIWFDNLNVVRSCSYYVQQMYSFNRGTNTLRLLDSSGNPYTGAIGQDNIYASAVWDSNDNSIIVKIVNTGDKSQNIKLVVDGMKRNESFSEIKVTNFSSDDIYVDNVPHDNLSINAESVLPVNSVINIYDKVQHLDIVIAPYTFAVYRLIR